MKPAGHSSRKRRGCPKLAVAVLAVLILGTVPRILHAQVFIASKPHPEFWIRAALHHGQCPESGPDPRPWSVNADGIVERGAAPQSRSREPRPGSLSAVAERVGWHRRPPGCRPNPYPPRRG